MSRERAELFRSAIDRKLAAEKIDPNNGGMAISALRRCVMGARLCDAYRVIYGCGA